MGAIIPDILGVRKVARWTIFLLEFPSLNTHHYRIRFKPKKLLVLLLPPVIAYIYRAGFFVIPHLFTINARSRSGFVKEIRYQLSVEQTELIHLSFKNLVSILIPRSSDLKEKNNNKQSSCWK